MKPIMIMGMLLNKATGFKNHRRVRYDLYITRRFQVAASCDWVHIGDAKIIRAPLAANLEVV